MRLVFAVRARQDIADIYDHIAKTSPVAAQRVEDRIRSVCESIQAFPKASIRTDEPGVRRVPLVRYPYAVYFHLDDPLEIVTILRVIHSARITNLGRLP